MSCFCLFFSSSFFFFETGDVGGYAVSRWSGAGQQSGHQRPAEVCDGECSWCLSLGAGRSYRQGLSCPTIKTHRGRLRLQRRDKYTLSDTLANTHTREHAEAKQAHEHKQQCRRRNGSSTKHIMPFLQTNHGSVLSFSPLIFFLLPNLSQKRPFSFLKVALSVLEIISILHQKQHVFTVK